MKMNTLILGYKNARTVFVTSIILCGGCAAHQPAKAGETPLSNAADLARKGLSSIARTYSETDLDDIFAGPTAMPQYLMLRGVIEEPISEGLGIPRTEVRWSNPVDWTEWKKAQWEKALKGEDFFQSAEFKYEMKDLVINFHIACGVHVSLGPKLTAAIGREEIVLRFDDAEKYLADKKLKTLKNEPSFALGSFSGKPLGEAAWHRADPQHRRYDLVWLRGLTIMHVQATLKEKGELKNAEEKLDAIAAQLDKWVEAHMFRLEAQKRNP